MASEKLFGLHEDGPTLIRLHEKWMDNMDIRVGKVEANVNKIPWILLVTVISVGISLLNLAVGYLK